MKITLIGLFFLSSLSFSEYKECSKDKVAYKKKLLKRIEVNRKEFNEIYKIKNK